MLLFAALIERIRVWRRERETITELQRLSDRDLFDLGIRPSDIRAVAKRAVAERAALAA